MCLYNALSPFPEGARVRNKGLRPGTHQQYQRKMSDKQADEVEESSTSESSSEDEESVSQQF